MKISIIIPVYRSLEYIKECLLSVSFQTHSIELECILVDDCGNDGSIDIAAEFIANYRGPISFNILSHEKNRGAAAARNTGLTVAKGDYVYFLDSDDMITPSCLEDMVNTLKKYPDVDMVCAGIKTSDGSIPWFDFEKTRFPEYTDDFHKIKVDLLGKEIIPASACSKLIRSDVLFANNIRFYEGIVIEDVLWCNILAKHVKSIAFINKNSYIYRIHDGSVVTSGLGVEPMRKLIVYNLMIDAIDEPYIQEQVEHLISQIEKVFFENQDPEIRREVGRLINKLCKYTERLERWKLFIKSFLARHSRNNQTFGYYMYNQMSMGDSFGNMLRRIIKRVFGN